MKDVQYSGHSLKHPFEISSPTSDKLKLVERGHNECLIGDDNGYCENTKIYS